MGLADQTFWELFACVSVSPYLYAPTVKPFNSVGIISGMNLQDVLDSAPPGDIYIVVGKF